MGHGLGIGHDAKVHLPVVAFHGDVQPQAVHHDRRGVVAHHAGAGQVQRHRRARHIADGQIGQQRQPVGHLGAAVQRRQRLHQPGHANRRVIGGQHAFKAAHGLFHRRGGGLDMGQPLAQIGDVGAQVDQAHRCLGVRCGVARGPQRHRHRRHQRFAGQRGMFGQIAPQRGGAQQQHGVVERGLVQPPQGLELGQRQADAGKAARCRDRGIERRARRQPQVADRAGAAFATQQPRVRQHQAGRIGQRAQRGRQVFDDARHLRCLLRQRAAQHLAQAQLEGLGAAAGLAAGLAARLAWRRRRHAAALGRGVQNHPGHGHRRLAVHRRMVKLRVDGHAGQAVGAGAQAFQHKKPPQRAASVQPLGVQPAHCGLQLGHAGALPGRPGQLDRLDMVFQVGIGIDPGRVGQVQWHPPQPPPKHRQLMQALGHVLAQPHGETAGLARRQFVDIECADMHRHLGGFKVKKGGVQAGKLLHGPGC